MFHKVHGHWCFWQSISIEVKPLLFIELHQIVTGSTFGVVSIMCGRFMRNNKTLTIKTSFPIINYNPYGLYFDMKVLFSCIIQLIHC